MSRALGWAIAGFAACLVFQSSVAAGLVITAVTAVIGAFQ